MARRENTLGAAGGTLHQVTRWDLVARRGCVARRSGSRACTCQQTLLFTRENLCCEGDESAPGEAGADDAVLTKVPGIRAGIHGARAGAGKRCAHLTRIRQASPLCIYLFFSYTELFIDPKDSFENPQVALGKPRAPEVSQLARGTQLASSGEVHAEGGRHVACLLFTAGSPRFRKRGFPWS